MTVAAIPSPTNAVWEIGPVPIRAYALCIILGIILAGVVTEFRLRQRGAHKWAILDIAVWAVPFGIIGARIYHVITSPGQYFGEGGDPLEALQVWKGGLGIWGAVAGGAVGALLAARQLGMPLTVVADALAPGLPLAQAVGRLGNWFNNELYGRQTTLPWGLEVHEMDSAGRPTLVDGEAVLRPGLYHPTFLYELVWNVLVAGLVLALDRKFKFGRGRAFALYVMGYTLGRFFIEMMRDDTATHIAGVRINVFVAALVFVGALAYFLKVRGPREYLIPVGVDAPVPAPRGGDISTVDVSAKPAATAAIPSSYRVVDEEQFHAYQATGVVPDGDAVPDSNDNATAKAESDGESDAAEVEADEDGQDSDTTAAGAGGRADDR
ncbi:prolipoprotein diacylglyceryl transferase [Asanoa siamensis]|uniref:Phosphatidylglycerol--prolipoprotein diacylglyceryl transferase n=1 Tax=Asanoa siamensis TaxID=926357 RepID=A0ABQ4CYC8_9ACTN|nr:prolipoprotein diacylglyceryl transferase [Asanoa siamensis]GIF76287.1 prolipoprotein diacylglyceryl transferase [Asanoa siamensis]